MVSESLLVYIEKKKKKFIFKKTLHKRQVAIFFNNLFSFYSNELSIHFVYIENTRFS